MVSPFFQPSSQGPQSGVTSVKISRWLEMSGNGLKTHGGGLPFPTGRFFHVCDIQAIGIFPSMVESAEGIVICYRSLYYVNRLSPPIIIRQISASLQL